MLCCTNSFSYSISNIGIEHTCIKIFWSVKEELWLKIKSFEASFIFSSGKSFKGLILSPICVKTSSPDTNLTNFSGNDTFFLINSEVFVFLKRKINIIYLFLWTKLVDLCWDSNPGWPGGSMLVNPPNGPYYWYNLAQQVRGTGASNVLLVLAQKTVLVLLVSIKFE